MRVGTGELTDSLATEHLTDFNFELFKLFDIHQHATLEIKTKSATLGRLLDRPGRKNITFSWSMNPSSIQQSEELGTASIDERLAAAKAVFEHGYSLAFHFDPLIDTDLKLYQECFEKIAQAIHPQALKWISLGSLRMTQGLRDQMSQRFPKSRLPLSEFLKTKDQKYRYAKPLRVKIFKHIYALIKQYGLDYSPIYLCMEPRHAWDQAFGGTPRKHPLFGAS